MCALFSFVTATFSTDRSRLNIDHSNKPEPVKLLSQPRVTYVDGLGAGDLLPHSIFKTKGRGSLTNP